MSGAARADARGGDAHGGGIDEWYGDGDSAGSEVASECEVSDAGVASDVEEDDERVEMLRAPVLAICSALGGYEHVQTEHGLETIYQLGDDCLECLRDLRRMWRQDDTDTSRAIARVFAELGTLHNDLIPILLHTAGGGEKGDKIALACTDLLTALTWPIDWFAEVRDIVSREEDEAVLSRVSSVRSAQVAYKASVLRVRAREERLAERTVLGCVMRHVLLPALAKSRAARMERDVGVISMCLHLFRNLLAIRDPVVTARHSAALAVNATLQSTLVEQLDACHALDTLLMLASHADTKEWESWSAVAADCIYHVYVGSDVHAVAAPVAAPVAPSAAAPRADPLAASLAAEQRGARRARHSRFSPSIQFTARDGTVYSAHSTRVLRESVPQLEMDRVARLQRRVARRRRAVERGAPLRYTAWTPGALSVLQRWADRFVCDGAFGILMGAYLRDIHAERERVGDLEAARSKALQLARFFLEYFLTRRGAAPGAFPLSLVGTWLEPWAFRLVRARAAVSLEGRSWLEFTSAVRLWTTLLRLVDALSRGDAPERGAADELQQALYYDGELLDTSAHVIHAYSTQSFACLEAVIDFAYTLPHQLARHAAAHEYLFVRRRQGADEDAERQERLFRFQSYERALATTRLAHAASQYLLRWQDSAHARDMLPKLVRVVHRAAVKAARPAIFLGAKMRAPWIALLRDDGPVCALRACDREAAQHLRKLGAFFQHTFRKLDAPAQAALDADKSAPRPSKTPPVQADIVMCAGLEHAEEIGVAIGLLVEQHKLSGVLWVKFGLESAVQARHGGADDGDYALVCDTPALRQDAMRNATLKLLCRLVGMHGEPVAVDEWRWTVPSARISDDLERDACIIDQYLAQPIDMGRDLKTLVQRQRATGGKRRADAFEMAPGEDAAAAHGRAGKKHRAGATRHAGTTRRAPRMPEWIDNAEVDSDEEYAFAQERDAAARGDDAHARAAELCGDGDSAHAHTPSSSLGSSRASSPPTSSPGAAPGASPGTPGGASTAACVGKLVRGSPRAASPPRLERASVSLFLGDSDVE
ncbi:Topoisomerase 1-associated factor 1 [Malassezia sp. CBS 17886]|nr:Topoisomerase 1-associated factor 1 [Malassezia sp. CBS 17886]